MIKILLACANQTALLKVQGALNQRDDIEIVGKTEALKEIRSIIGPVDPTIIVISELSDEHIYELAKDQPNIHILAVVTRCDWERALSMIQCGVKAVLIYDDLITHLPLAVREIVQGKFYLSSSIISSLLEVIYHTNFLKVREGSFPSKLTPREYDVVKLLIVGRTDAEIANELMVTVRTVRYHLTNVMLKLRANNRTEIAVKVLKLIGH